MMDLVYGSSSSSYMDCKVIFGDECFHIRRSGVRLDQCSCVGAFVIGLIIFGSYFYSSTTFRMSTRRLPVLLFVSRFECPFISCCLLRGVPMVAGGGFYFVCIHRPPPTASVGSPPTLPHAVMLRVIQSTVVVLILANFITMSVSCPSGLCLLPPFRWLTVRRP